MARNEVPWCTVIFYPAPHYHERRSKEQDYDAARAYNRNADSDVQILWHAMLAALGNVFNLKLFGGQTKREKSNFNLASYTVQIVHMSATLSLLSKIIVQLCT